MQVLIYLFVNSLAPGRFQFNFRQVIFKLISVNGGWGISYEIALRWMPLDLTGDKSTLVQVMAGAVRKQAITCTNVDPDLSRHMESLGHNELITMFVACSISSCHARTLKIFQVEYICENITIHFHFPSFLNAMMAQVV